MSLKISIFMVFTFFAQLLVYGEEKLEMGAIFAVLFLGIYFVLAELSEIRNELPERKVKGGLPSSPKQISDSQDTEVGRE